MTRQNFYKTRKQRQIQALDEGLIKRFVLDERASQPRLGGRKLLKILRPKLNDCGIGIGRDRFFKVLKKQGLLVEKLAPSHRTTNSYHNLPVFLNRVKGRNLTGPNQVWASDITYLRKKDTFMYLSLITDMYSRKIVGYHLGENLATEETLKALKMALKNKPTDERPIHTRRPHSSLGLETPEHIHRLAA